MTRKRAVITGITGQDGHYLAEYLIGLDYEVIGIVRPSTTHEPDVPKGAFYIFGDVTDARTINSIADIRPDELYNLAASSHVGTSFSCPVSTFATNALGALNMFEVARRYQSTRVYQASTSELFGNSPPPHSERTTIRPRSPYGVAKAAAHYAAINYREAYGAHISTGILFNHESPRRGHNFVTQKICQGVARIVLQKQDVIELGNLDVSRDWGHAKDYVRAMHAMLQQDEPGDYVIATGQAHSLRDFLDAAFQYVGIEDWGKYVVSNPEFYRPSDVDYLCGDPSKARSVLEWEPEISFDQLVADMMEAALERQES